MKQAAVRILIPVFCAVVLAGCASIDPSRERALVLDEVSERTGYAAETVTPPAGQPLAEDEAVAMAIANNRRLMAQLAEAGLARADWVTASRPTNPVIGVTSFPGNGTGRIWDVDLRASLLGIAATPWRAEAAHNRYEARQSETVLAVIDFIAETRRAWVDAVAARQRLDLQQRIRDAAAASLVVAEEMRSAGNSPLMDLERERVFAEQAELDFLAAEHTALQARLMLSRQLGVEITADSLPDRLEGVDPAGFDIPDADAMTASLPLAAARARVEATAGEAGLENWATLLEHVELGGVWERDDREWSRGWTLEFALPVFDPGEARRTAGRLRAEQAIDHHAGLVHEIRTSIQAAEASADLAQARLARIEGEALPTSERLMDATMRQYNAMQVSVFDLMAAVQMRTRTGQSYVDALTDLHRARIALQQIRAGGSPHGVGLSAAGGAAPMMAEGGH